MSAQEGDVIETITLQVRAGDGSGRPLSIQQEPSEAHDVWTYRLAVGSVGVALVVFLIGAAVILALGEEVSTQYWTAGGALSGALLGILVPSPPPRPPAREEHGLQAFGKELIKPFVDLWKNRAVLILLLIFAAAVWRDIEEKGPEWQALAGAAGGALIGVLSPSPGKKA